MCFKTFFSLIFVRDAFQLKKPFISGTCPNQGKGGSWQAAYPEFLNENFSSRFQGGGGVWRGMEVEFQISENKLNSIFHGGSELSCI